VLLLVSLTEERAIYLALELDRSWTEMTGVNLWLANCYFDSHRACNNVASSRRMLFISKALLILAEHRESCKLRYFNSFEFFDQTGTIWKRRNKEEERKNARFTLTGLLMEGVAPSPLE
jgi:hypothetical protein